VPHFPAYAGKVPFHEEVCFTGRQVAAHWWRARGGAAHQVIGTVGDDERGRIQMESLAREAWLSSTSSS